MTTITKVDDRRRLWLTASAAMGGAGLAATAVPFVASFAPSERARALGAAVEVDVQGVGADLNLTHRADPILTRGWMPAA